LDKDYFTNWRCNGILLAGKTDIALPRGNARQYDDLITFRVAGERRVTTRRASFDAVEVGSWREEGSKRQTTLWVCQGDFN